MPAATASCTGCSTKTPRHRCWTSTRCWHGSRTMHCCSTRVSRRTSRPAISRVPSTSALQGRFAEWAGDVLSPDRDVVLVGDPAVALEAKVRLGTRRIRPGHRTARRTRWCLRLETRRDRDELSADHRAARRTSGARAAAPARRRARPGETAGGTLPGAREIPLAVLTDSLDGLDPAHPVVVYCASGYRSQVAASVLLDAGFADVSDLLGGYGAWEGAGCRRLARRWGPGGAPRRRSAPAPPRRSSTLVRCSSTCESPTSGMRNMRPAPRCCRWARCAGTSRTCPATDASWWCAVPAAAPRR